MIDATDTMHGQGPGIKKKMVRNTVDTVSNETRRYTAKVARGAPQKRQKLINKMDRSFGFPLAIAVQHSLSAQPSSGTWATAQG